MKANTTRMLTDQRRSLHFDNLSQIMPEVQRLIPAHRTVGNWTLAQVCKHLADSFRGSLEGFDLSRHRFKRWFFRRPMLRYTLIQGIPPGYTVNEHLTPPPGVKLDDAVQQLGQAMERYQAYRGRLHAHPLFGSLGRPMWDRLHCIHSAHHLSFVIPTEETSVNKADTGTGLGR